MAISNAVVDHAKVFSRAGICAGLQHGLETSQEPLEGVSEHTGGFTAVCDPSLHQMPTLQSPSSPQPSGRTAPAHSASSSSRVVVHEQSAYSRKWQSQSLFLTPASDQSAKLLQGQATIT